MAYNYRKSITNDGTIEVITGQYLIDGIEFPSPSSIDCEYHGRTRARNDVDDITHIKTKRGKKTVTWHYKNVSNETFYKFYKYLVKDNFEKGNIFFNIQTQFIGELEPINMYVYCGFPLSSQSVHGSKDRLLVNFDLHFVEPEGIACSSTQQ